MPRIFYIDLVRVLAVFAVVVTHQATGISRQYELTNGYWFAGALWYCLSRCCVPLFVMASGALVLGSYRPEGAVRRYAGSAFRKLVVPLLAWSLVYVLDARFRTGRALDLRGVPLRVLIEDQAGHLWFLYMFAGLYLCVPLVAAMWRRADRPLKWLFAAVWAYAGVNAHLGQWGLPAMSFHVPFNPAWMGYFILGHELHRAGERLTGRRPAARALAAAAVSVLLMLGEMLLIRRIHPPPENATLSFGGLTVIAYSAAVWLLAANACAADEPAAGAASRCWRRPGSGA